MQKAFAWCKLFKGVGRNIVVRDGFALLIRVAANATLINGCPVTTHDWVILAI